MRKDDWAVVVGIDTYFDSKFPALQGPDNDARAFYEWVTSPTGGAVPKDQALGVFSSDFARPFPALTEARPTTEQITAAINRLIATAEASEERGDGLKAGDRLYLFFAGHGFAPSHRRDWTALLMANADTVTSQLAHFLGTYIADWMRDAAFFREVFLFMDCCRSIDDCDQLFMPYPAELSPDRSTVRSFYAYGAREGAESRERNFNGKIHGVFTRALIDALQGAAYDPTDPAHITAESLRDHLYNSFKKYMDPQHLNNPRIPQEPQVDFEQKADKLVIGPVPAHGVLGKMRNAFGLAKPAELPVRIVTTDHVGKDASVWSSDLKVIATKKLGATTELMLARGMYALEIAGVEPRTFEVTGAGGTVDVTV